MKTIPRTLLIASIVALALSFTGPGSAIGYGLLKPIGAVLFIVFYMANLLAKEIPQFDEEQRRHLEDAERQAAPLSEATGKPRFAPAY